MIDTSDYGSGISIFYGIHYKNHWINRNYSKGTISKESNEPITSEIKFDIASLTKTFTAVLIHQAVEEKRFTYQTKIIELEPKFKNLKDVTIEDLLCHRLEIWTPGYLGDAKTRAEFDNILFNAYVKSTNSKYIDVHYIILSKVLEKVYQQSFDNLMKEKILNPLYLINTSFHIKKGESVVSCDGEWLNGDIVSISSGEVHDKKARIGKKLSIYMGHAGLFSTAHDMFLFLKSLIDGSEALLKKKTTKHFFDHDNYDTYLKKCLENKVTDIIKPYTYGGMRYKITNEEYNPVKVPCSNDTYIFSGYTGPIYLVDKKQKIIIVVMINSVHQSRKTRQERLTKGISIIEEIYENIKKEFFI